MKTKKIVITCLSLLSLASLSNGAVTINFNAPFLGGVSSNLANAAGDVANGMTWGIIVDGTGGGFAGNYDSLSAGALTNSSVATNNYFFLGGTTSDSSQGGLIDEGDFAGTGAGNGGIGAMAFAFTGSVNANDVFRVVWLSGNKIGTLSDPSFVVPADGQIVTYDAPFVGVDPIRTAGLAYSGTTAASTGQGFSTAVPEPSSLLLGALGLMGLLRRKRA